MANDTMLGLPVVAQDNLEGEVLQLHYVPVRSVLLWPANPKRHDLGAIMESIQKYGFRDPSTFDSALGGLVEGNGRATALDMMEKQGYDVPRGVLKSKVDGHWCMPILFGIDATSKSAAEQYAIDHNNLTMAGGDFTLYDMARMWDKAKYIAVLEGLSAEGDDEMPVTVNLDDLHVLMQNEIEFENDIPDLTDEDDIDEGQQKETIKVEVINFNLIDDVTDAIRELLDEHPEWNASVVSK